VSPTLILVVQILILLSPQRLVENLPAIIPNNQIELIFTPLFDSFNNLFNAQQQSALMGVIRPLFILLKASIHNAHQNIMDKINPPAPRTPANFHSWAKLISSEKWHVVSFLPVVVRYFQRIEYNARVGNQIHEGLDVWKISPDPNNNIPGMWHFLYSSIC
jgi:hypothetical protein